MKNSSTELRFDNARKRLADALKSLEESVKKKLHEGAIGSKMLDVGHEDFDGAQAKLIEQAVTIENLNSEINNLQKNLSLLGRDTEFMNTKNKIFAEKINEIRTQQSDLIIAIETDLAQIEEIINNKE